MAVYLSLGSNQGDRRANLRNALAELADDRVVIERVSPVVESPALLPPDAPGEWNSPFLNLVAECRVTLEPAILLTRIKQIERSLGRSDTRRWSPRPIDIDILIHDDTVLDTADLTVPHPGLTQRGFVLTPLAALAPSLTIPGLGKTARELSRAHSRPIPLWMGIVNLTPDSFSDGGENDAWPEIEARVVEMVSTGVHVLDFGAESTRPGATPLSPADEWRRLEPALVQCIETFRGDWLRPRFSVDTYHAEVAARALDAGADIVNDVGGLTDPAMLGLAASSSADFIAMHNLGLPADPSRTLDTAQSAVDQVEAWLEERIESWQKAGIDLDRIVFDPGIGFGKNPLQSLELLREIARFGRNDLRLLVGHSRKSFMRGFAGQSNEERDLVTIGSSLALCERGVDILRVHNTTDHIRAYRGWSHSRSPG
ncbi:MAG: dihydropteroate synthase [Gammaproteobacteria bacterium]|jgi:2-amino-4-hydroxy-6-hydroxymethyldihydropteridine diphosphokinase/dihydropteroate synthase